MHKRFLSLCLKWNKAKLANTFRSRTEHTLGKYRAVDRHKSGVPWHWLSDLSCRISAIIPSRYGELKRRLGIELSLHLSTPQHLQLPHSQTRKFLLNSWMQSHHSGLLDFYLSALFTCEVIDSWHISLHCKEKTFRAWKLWISNPFFLRVKKFSKYSISLQLFYSFNKI